MERLGRRIFDSLAVASLLLFVMLLGWRIFGKGHQIISSWTAFYSADGGKPKFAGSGVTIETDYCLRFASHRLTFSAALVLLLICPAMWLLSKTIRHFEKSSDLRSGLCTMCGYDLRATPERCPECGTIPEKAK
jgi:hypothetical protein